MDPISKFGILRARNVSGVDVYAIEPEGGARLLPARPGDYPPAWIDRRVEYRELGGYAVDIALA